MVLHALAQTHLKLKRTASMGQCWNEVSVHFQTQIASTHSSVHNRAGTQYDLAKDRDTGCESLSAVIENL